MSTSTNFSIQFTSHREGLEGNVLPGQALCRTGSSTLVLATAANIILYGRPVCVAVEAGDSNTPVIVQYSGELPNAQSGITAGIACAVRVAASGSIERANPALPGDVLVGFTDVYGNVQLSLVAALMTSATMLSMVGQVQGDILYFDGTDWVVLHPGVAGQFLQTNGPAMDPAWGSASAGGGVIYRPGGVTSGSVVATWAEVQAAVAATSGALTVYIDDSIVTPAPVPGASGITDFQGRTILQGFTDAGGVGSLIIEDGAQLKDYWAMQSLHVLCACQTVPSLDLTSPRFAIVQYGSLIELDATATIPAFNVGAGELNATFIGIGAQYSNAAAPAVPFFDVAVGGTMVFYIFGVNSDPGSNTVQGGPGSQFIVFRDSSSDAPPQAAFTGTYNDAPLDKASAMFYADSFPLLGSNTVQGAIDALKSAGFPEAVIFDGGATTKNLRADKPANNSAINNAADGIVSFASNTGIGSGASGNYSSILGGDEHAAGADYATVCGGKQNQANATYSITCGGNGNNVQVGSDKGSICGGANNLVGFPTASQFAHIGGGQGNQTAGDYAFIGGGHSNVCDAEATSIPGGYLAKANRYGQQSYAAGAWPTASPAGNRQLSRYVVFGTDSVGGGVSLLDEIGNELNLEDGRSYALRATCLGVRTDAPGRAMFVNDLLVHANAGAAVIDNDNSTLTAPNGEAWTIVYSAVGANIVATFTGTAGQTVRAVVSYEFLESTEDP